MPRIKLKKIRGSRVLLYLFVIALVSFTALPLIYVICTAFKPIDELYIWPPRFFVRQPTLHNFSDLLTALGNSSVPFTRYIFNSLFVTMAVVLGTVLVSAMGAYGLAKHRPAGSGVIMAVVMAALMFSPYTTQIPNYLIVKEMGLLNTYAALIIPKLAVAYNFFLMERFAGQIPNALLEACRIDGAGDFRIVTSIIAPIVKPALATVAILAFQASWNNAEISTYYVNNDMMRTFAFYLSSMIVGMGNNVAGRGILAAATLVMFIPNLLIFIFMQNKVLNTMAHSGIK